MNGYTVPIESNWAVCKCGMGFSRPNATEATVKMWWRLHSKKCDVARKIGPLNFGLREEYDPTTMNYEQHVRAQNEENNERFF